MRHAKSALLTLLMSATQTYAQGICPTAIPAPDPCLAGHWVGSNSMLDRMHDLVASMPSSVGQTIPMPSMPATLGITIQNDGWYSTLPLHQNVAYESIIDDESHLIDMDLTVGTSVGWIWNEGSQLRFCGDQGAGNLHFEATGPDGTRTADIPVSETPPPWFTPDIDYTCAGNSLSFTVYLPEPIGEVQYWLTKFPADRFAEEFRRRLPDE